MISVDEALAKLCDLAVPLQSESVSLTCAAGRVLCAPVVAHRDQPPFAASAMDGYAICEDGPVALGTTWQVIGESAAGHRYDAHVAHGQAVRIFTGAPMPTGTGRVIIQENVARSGDTITLTDTPGDATHVRAAGCDFKSGFTVAGPVILGPSEVALLAAMNAPTVTVTCKPKVAIISTGDELVHPGETPADDQIVASNIYGLKAMFDAAGADTRMLPTAKDDMDAIKAVFELANDADLVVTVGGASVGDHDLVGATLDDMGFAKSFYKIRMRPGKPLMASKRGDQIVVGLPGNPVSALVCGRIFCVPLIRHMLGIAQTALHTQTAELANDITANGPREHFMRGRLAGGKITVFDRQDSALLSVMNAANVLVRRPVDDPPQSAGTPVAYVPL